MEDENVRESLWFEEGVNEEEAKAHVEKVLKGIKKASAARFKRLNIVDNVIYFKVRQQDGTFQAMKCKDTMEARMFVDWLQRHDGYHGKGIV